MSVNDDLASWGEPPANPTELACAEFLDGVLADIEKGRPSKTARLWHGRPDLVKQGETLVDGATLLYQSSSSIQEHSGVLDDPFGTLAVVEAMDSKERPRITGTSLPDPFPGEYRIRQSLGEGSFGKVWLADDLNLGRQVALKTLKLSGQSEGRAPVLAALQKEARLLAALRHPNIVQVHAWRQSADQHYLVLQYVPGGSLAERVRAGPLTWQDATRYIADAGEGLLQVHTCGIVHRDIKPANILWDPEKDEALLTDFGVSSRLTEPGTIAGTPAFMPVEAFDGKVSTALDVYGLAATLYRLIAGEVPFPAKGIPALLEQVRRGLPDPDPRCCGMPEAIERVIRCGLASDPGQRPSLNEFVEKLRVLLNQSLADAVVPTVDKPRPAPMNLRMVVSREVEPGVYKPLATTQPNTVGLRRDMKKVPRSPAQVSVRTGERVRVEVVADKAGYVTVFNIGPTGNLNLLYPDDPKASPSPVEANRPLHVVDVEMAPPAGPERICAVWSKAPLTLRLEQLLSIAERSPASTRPYQSTRDMKRVQRELAAMPHEAWNTAVVELNHVAG
jgi:serine/threonine-protein kinase